MAKRKTKPKPPNLKIGEGNYTEARKAWVASLTMEDIIEAHKKYTDADALADYEASRRRRKKRKAS